MNRAELEQLKVPGPTITNTSRPFWEAASKGRFQLQHCEDCGCWVFYPRSNCPGCWGSRLVWRSASGLGRLKSYSIVHRPGHPGWESVAPYPVAVVELHEGPTMLTMLVEVNEGTLHIGMNVEVCHVRVGEHVLPMFTAAGIHSDLPHLSGRVD